MKAIAEKLALNDNCSFREIQWHVPGFEFNWHFHPEFELTYIPRGMGQRYVGDNIRDFNSGELVLLGPNLPHTWVSSPDPDDIAHESHVIQFMPDFLGASFFKTPEMRQVQEMLIKSYRGLLFTSTTAEKAAKLLAQLNHSSGPDRLVLLLQIFSHLAEDDTACVMSSAEYRPMLNTEHLNRIDDVFDFISKHFKDPIKQPDAAKIVHMSSSHFSRFFKRMTGRTFANYLNEVRIGYASRQLIESDLTITEISFAAGFTNLSNFNRRFLDIKKITPRAFRNSYK